MIGPAGGAHAGCYMLRTLLNQLLLFFSLDLLRHFEYRRFNGPRWCASLRSSANAGIHAAFTR